MTHSPVTADVRMRGFPRRSTVEATLQWADAQTASRLPAETILLGQSAGRVLAEDVISDCDVPRFARSMMDGFAVLAADTQGATAYNRLPLTVIGEVLPGLGFAGE